MNKTIPAPPTSDIAGYIKALERAHKEDGTVAHVRFDVMTDDILPILDRLMEALAIAKSPCGECDKWMTVFIALGQDPMDLFR